MNLTYEYRLFPRKSETQALDKLLEQGREVYNWALAQSKTRYETSGQHATGLGQWAYFREWRKQPGILLNASSLQHLLRRLDKAYSAFFSRIKAGETPGHPRFKPAQRFTSIEYTYGDGCKFTPGAGKTAVLYIQNVAHIKVKFHRALPENAVIKHVLIKRKNRQWFVYLMLQLPDRVFAPNGLPAVGGDMGLLRLLTFSDETLIDNPRWLRHTLSELRRAQRRLSRRKKGSQRRRKAAFQVARLHEHVSKQRKDFWHKLTFGLVNAYGLIALEDLELKFMLLNHKLSLSAHDAGLGIFQSLLRYKAVKAGCAIELVDPAYTSQVCSGCGCVVEKALSERVHRCPNPKCLLVLDRDVNAARNILSLALKSAGTPPSGAKVAGRRKPSLRSSRLKTGELSPSYTINKQLCSVLLYNLN